MPRKIWDGRPFLNHPSIYLEFVSEAKKTYLKCLIVNSDVAIRRKRFWRRGSKGENFKKRREKSPISGKSPRPLSVRDLRFICIYWHKAFLFKMDNPNWKQHAASVHYTVGCQVVVGLLPVSCDRADQHSWERQKRVPGSPRDLLYRVVVCVS